MKDNGQEYIQCKKCDEWKHRSEFVAGWDTLKYTRCIECRKEDKRLYNKKFHDKKKKNQQLIRARETMNLDTSHLFKLIHNTIIICGDLSCARCAYSIYPDIVRLISIDGAHGEEEAIQIYVSNPTIQSWQNLVQTISYLIPLCANCLKMFESGLLLPDDLHYHYTRQQLNNIMSING